MGSKSDCFENIEKSFEFLEEINRYIYYRKTIYEMIQRIEFSYQNRKFGYLKYRALLEKILKGKTEEETLEYYDAHIEFLIKELQINNDKIFLHFYEDLQVITEPETKKSVQPKPYDKKDKTIADKISVKAKENSAEKISEKKQESAIASGKSFQEIIRAKADQNFKTSKAAEEEIKKEINFHLSVQENKKTNFFQNVINSIKALFAFKIPENDSKNAKMIEDSKNIKQEKEFKFSFDEKTSPVVSELKNQKQPSYQHQQSSSQNLSKSQPLISPSEKAMPKKEKLSVEELKKELEKEAGKIKGKKLSNERKSFFDQIKSFFFPFSKKKEIFSETNSETTFSDDFKREDFKISEAQRKVQESKQSTDELSSELDQLSKKYRTEKSEILEAKKPNQVSLFGMAFPNVKIKLFDFSAKKKKLDDVIGTETKLGKNVFQLAELEDPEIDQKGSRINPNLLAQEAKRIKNILKKESRVKIYKPSNIGAIANSSTKKISLYLLEKYPDFFRYLYNSLRSANIKILSNTYVNIMVLFTVIAFISSMIFFIPFLFLSGYPLLVFLFGSVFLSAAIAAGTFFSFYFYPSTIIRKRKKNINTNLPFAVTHMSAVIGSGVPPVAMFKLISESEEYEEISKELAKIVEYVEIFGYDMVTATKTVAATTPSPQFKEFLDGLVSNLESGGDIKEYMDQKASESMLNYKLERDKFLELISTYSDIYTGIMIAAPLFFVVALSLVSILGGQIGGIDVNVLMAIGTYVVIPGLNIGFILFLDATQPDV